MDGYASIYQEIRNFILHIICRVVIDMKSFFIDSTKLSLGQPNTVRLGDQKHGT